MSLVGDIIMDLRARIPDAPSILNAPIIVSATALLNNTGGAFLNQTVTLVATVTNQWGETTTSAEFTVPVIAPNNAVLLDINFPSDSAFTGINTVNIYYGLAGAGSESSVVSFPPSSSIILSQLGAPSRPPNRPTAFLPDTDGNFIGAFTAYRLLNRALQEMIKIGGGIVDLTGVQSQINQSMYRLASPFYTFTNAWYDGYPVDIVPRNFMYLRNSAAGFSGILSYEQDGPQSVIQVWPQSNRTGGSTQLAQPMDAVQNSFVTTSGSVGFLSIGLAQIDQEIVGFSFVPSTNTFGGVTRGMGGTDAVAHASGAPVIELNIRLSGYRLAKNYVVGNAYQTIMVPQAWETPLVLHMLSQVRSMEQDDATAEKLLADFQSQADKIAKQSRLGRVKPRQIPVWGQNTSDARNVNGIGFGWLIN
jgi:hypothetical protein